MTATAEQFPHARRGTVRESRGFCEIGIWHSKTPDNLGTLWRSAYQLGAAGVFTVGRRYERQPSDTTEASRHIPLRHFTGFDEFASALPRGAALVAVEMGGRSLWSFAHPQQAIYLLGAEDHGIPAEVLARCDHRISLEAARVLSYNVAVAGSIVLYHRLMQRGAAAISALSAPATRPGGG